MFYWLTRSSIIVPLSIFTLFLSEIIKEPWLEFDAGGVSLRSEIPITPSVWAVMGGRAPALVWESLGMLPLVEAEADGDDGDDPAIPGRPAEFALAPEVSSAAGLVPFVAVF